MNVTISEIKREARSKLKGVWGFGVFISLLVFALIYIGPLIIELLFAGFNLEWQETASLSSLVVFNVLVVAYSVALIPLSAAVIWLYLSIARSEKPKIKELFSVFNNVKTPFKVIGTTILIGIFIYLWSLLLIIPGIIKSISYSQAFLIMKDHPEYSPLQAIRESKIRMKGYKWKYFLLNLSFIGWAFLTIFTVGIGALWLYPYIYTSQAVFYNTFINPQGIDEVLEVQSA